MRKKLQILIAALSATLILGSSLSAKEITATVKRANPEAKTLSLDNGKTVKVSPGDAAIGYESQQVRGQLDTSSGAEKLDFIWPANPREEQIAGDINKLLRTDTVTRGRKAFRGVGDPIPNFGLYNEEGELVTARTLRGKNLVINFIFTRCNVPTMCPASTARMGRLQREAAEAGLENLELVTFTFDPEYDTPGVLRFYAETRGLDLDNYTLLTGDPEAISDLMKQFGILTMEADGTINHTMATLIVNEQGNITYRKDGSRWSTQDFLERLQAMENDS